MRHFERHVEIKLTLDFFSTTRKFSRPSLGNCLIWEFMVRLRHAIKAGLAQVQVTPTNGLFTYTRSHVAGVWYAGVQSSMLIFWD